MWTQWWKSWSRSTGKLTIPTDCEADAAIAAAKTDDKIAAAIEGKNIVKEIYVKGKLVNIVVKP